MFGIGPSELIIILVIALLVLGPKRLPELAAGLGKGLAEFRRATADINAELDDTRRALEEESREAARAAQQERVARTAATAPKAVEPGTSPATTPPNVASSSNLASLNTTSPNVAPPNLASLNTTSPNVAAPAGASPPDASRTGDKPADADAKESASDPKAPA